MSDGKHDAPEANSCASGIVVPTPARLLKASGGQTWSCPGATPGRTMVIGLSRVAAMTVHCGVGNQGAGHGTSGRQTRRHDSSPRHAQSRSRSGEAVIWPREAGCRHSMDGAHRPATPRAQQQRDAPAGATIRVCRTPGLNSPAWVPDWVYAQTPEPPDANRPLNPQTREPACTLKAA